MSAGLPKYVVVNLSDLDKAFKDGETVNLETVQDKNLLNISGRDARLQLKVSMVLQRLCEATAVGKLCRSETACSNAYCTGHSLIMMSFSALSWEAGRSTDTRVQRQGDSAQQ